MEGEGDGLDEPEGDGRGPEGWWVVAVQVTWTARLVDGVLEGAAVAGAFAGAELMKTNARPGLPPGVTVTFSVTDWPARSVPCWLLNAT